MTQLVPAGAPRGRALLPLVVCLAVLLVVTTTVVVALRWDRQTLTDSALPADVLSPSGSPLPDGFTVPEGAQLIGVPLEYDPVSGALPPGSWTVVLSVTGDPIATWSAMVEQLPGVLNVPDDHLGYAEGCGSYDGFFECSIQRGGPEPEPPATTLDVYLAMQPVAGDVTGHYSLVMSGRRTDRPSDTDSLPWTGGSAPQPPPARARPDVGEPLAPETVAYDGDNERYVLLDGSELLVQYSPGSITGGFGVLLRVTPDADVREMAAAYAEQARQYDGATPQRVTTNEHSTVHSYVPSGGAGGYQGWVYGLDADDGDDFIYYDLYND